MATTKNFQNGFNYSGKKSLIETIDEVKKSSKSRNEKIIMLKACGLRDKEISDILRTYVPKGIKVGGRFVYTFGVEIECYHANRTELLMQALAYGVKLESQGYNHTDSHETFKIVSDGSLSGVDNNEIVSPVLSGNKKGLDQIKAITKCLDGVGARVNRSCGLHVHIGTKNLSFEQYLNVFKNYAALERLIDTFMPESRRGDNAMYARSLSEFNFNDVHTHQDLERMMGSRYYKVNAYAWSRHNTIEFRQHSGTTDYKKISNWVKFCAKLVAWSRTNVFETIPVRIQDIPFLNEEEKQFFATRATSLAQA